MTHYGGKDLARSFRQVRGNTIQTAEDIPADKYGFQASPDTRSIGATLVHITVSTGFQDYIQRNEVTDLKDVNFMELFQKFSAEEAKPRTKAETIAYLKSQGEAFASFLEGLSDEFQAEVLEQGGDLLERLLQAERIGRPALETDPVGEPSFHPIAACRDERDDVRGRLGRALGERLLVLGNHSALMTQRPRDRLPARGWLPR